MKTRWIEFLIVSSIYLFLLITIAHDIDSGKQAVGQLHLFTVYTTVSFYVLYIYPNLFLKQKMYTWSILIVITFLLEAFCHFALQNWSPLPPHQIIPPFALSGMVTLALLVYTAVKTTIKALKTVSNRHSIQAKVGKELLISLVIGIAILIPISLVNTSIAALTGFTIPFCYTLFAVHYHFLLPYLDQNKTPKTIHIILSILLNLICIALFSSLMEITLRLLHSFNKFISFNGFNILFCFLLGTILTPVIYIFYYRSRKQQTQIVGLKKELGKTSADLKLLQSQINPHFLFNAMNTLYGIALQENAERTSSGIQKLSDMMRFMLHENQQDRILLVREIAYLKEYIELQKLRIANLPSIQITVDLPEDEYLGDQRIAPMLLIPFIENAFKHGISLNKPSWIRIQLHKEEDTLKLNVYNSIHAHTESDPERNKSGIGLENVEHRLTLLYKDLYQLHIETTNTEYFVFLTLKLTDIDPEV
ncbi:sensor histidine kinase [Sphingobacterium lumbrici]|uniref:sensor histidine kinase n=1 Tax=Sphingobacterium lumbrici TaxID=2559600 RepID=UPI00112EA4F5|nr:histidine kinase [Sphingobacterium lumbrici]